MHELGILVEIVRRVEQVMDQQGLTQVESLVLQIGEMASVVPYFVEQCYPAAVNGTRLENTRLEIEILPANARCKACGHVFHLQKDVRVCPTCGGTDWELLGGREFMIKQIVAC